jgi:hypothetical protein
MRKKEHYAVAVAAKRCKQYVHNAMQTGKALSLQLSYYPNRSIPDKLNKGEYKTCPIEREAFNVRQATRNKLIKNAISK